MLDDLYGQLELIEELVLLVQNQIVHENRESFLANREASDLVAYRMGTIGEYIKRVPSEVRDRHPEIPWREIAKFRDLMAHHYDRLDPTIVWFTAKERLDEIGKMCREEKLRLDLERAREERAQRDRDGGRDR